MSTTASPTPGSRAAARARCWKWTTRNGVRHARQSRRRVLHLPGRRRHMVGRGKGGSLVAMAGTAAIEGAAGPATTAQARAASAPWCAHSPSSWRATTSLANSILPGWIETEMTAYAIGNEKFAGSIMPRIPERRWGVGADFGPIAGYPASGAPAMRGARLCHRWRLHAALSRARFGVEHAAHRFGEASASGRAC